MSYIPQPGTVPHRVINWLRLQPEGTEVPTSVLAEELGIEKSHVGPSLKAPVSHGALTFRKEKGLAWYGLGNGVPMCAAPDYELDEPLVPEQDILIARQLKTKAVAPLIKAVSTPIAATAPALSKPNKPHVATQPKAFRVGEFSDGTLVIERAPYDRYELSPEEAKVLMDFAFDRRAA